VPFPVLLDEDGLAAEIIGTGTLGAISLVNPGQLVAGFRSLAGGHRQRKPGRRPMQLGATIVMGPGDVILYEDYEDHAGDHADLDEVIAAIGS
jgi:hypothetical protein